MSDTLQQPTHERRAGGDHPTATGRSATTSARLTGTLLTGPAWLLMIAVLAIPLALALYTSLTDSDLASIEPTQFIGIENFRDQILTGSFLQSVLVTAVIMAMSLLVQLPLGLAVALALSRPFRGRAILRSAATIPMMLTPVAVGLMWRFLADPDLGVIRLIASVFVHDAHPNLFGSRTGALALIVIVNSWINLPFVALLLTAGLLAVPDELREAAAIDGAGPVAAHRHIVLPLLLPVIAVVAVLRAAADYRMFDLVYVITQGGPGDATRNLSLLAYQQGLVNFQLGRSCAIAVAMAILAAPAYWLYAKVIQP